MIEHDDEPSEADLQLERGRLALRNAGCPHRTSELVLAGGLERTDAMAFLAEPSPDRPLTLLAGPPGVGKTVASVHWLLQHDSGRRPTSLIYLTASELTRWPRYDSEQMGSLEHASAVVVDDLGREYTDAKGFFLAILEELVDMRYQSGRPLVCTTNCTAEKLWERVGERVRDRWREAGRVFEIRGESLRRQQSQRTEKKEGQNP